MIDNEELDIKDTWGADSSPGTAADPGEKCGDLFATMGAHGTATILASDLVP